MTMKIHQSLLVLVAATALLLLLFVVSVATAGPIQQTFHSQRQIIAHVFKNPQTGIYSFLEEQQQQQDDDGVASSSSSSSTTHHFAESHCKIVVNNTINETGWYGIEVSPDRELLYSDPKEAYYSMGLLEGKYTAPAITDMFFNHLSLWQSFTPSFLQWFDTNIAEMKRIAETERWSSVQGTALYRFMAQMHGITDGYNLAVDAGTAGTGASKITFRDTFLMNAAAEFSDVVTAITSSTSSSVISEDERAKLEKFRTLLQELYRPTQHCSALIKVTDDDVFFSHDTWNNFQGMLRMFKVYNWETTVSFSSAPSRINSGDDYYTTGNNLGVMETTLIQNNATLTRMYVKPNLILYFLRIMTCNVWTNNSQDFFAEFLVRNSGSYCNQNMVIDMNLITSADLAAGLLKAQSVSICEQLPGPYSVIEDVTWFVNAHKFWPSFNVAFTQQVYEMSGNKALCDSGSVFCNTSYARPRIFARDQGKVRNLADMQNIMRYNGYLIDDPLQIIPHCDGCNPIYNPSLAIACRSDLVPLNASFGNYSTANAQAVNYSLFGAIDTKVSSWSMMMMNKNKNNSNNSNSNNGGGGTWSSIISGPSTSNGIPVFDWSQQADAITSQIRGIPTRYDFPFVAVRTTTNYSMTWREYHQKYPNGPAKKSRKDDDHDHHQMRRLIGAMVGGAAGLTIVMSLLVWRKKFAEKQGGDKSVGSVQGRRDGSYKQVV